MPLPHLLPLPLSLINQLELVDDVAVPVCVRQVVLCSPKPWRRPRLNWRRSSSTIRSQVCLGRPGRRLQFLQACGAREWSCDLSARVTWPNNFRCLVRTVADSSGCPVRLRTMKFESTTTVTTTMTMTTTTTTTTTITVTEKYRQKEHTSIGWIGVMSRAVTLTLLVSSPLAEPSFTLRTLLTTARRSLLAWNAS